MQKIIAFLSFWCIYSIPPAVGIVYRVKPVPTARLQISTTELLHQRTSTHPPTTTTKVPTTIRGNDLLKRKYINDDYFSATDDLPFVDPWKTVYPAKTFPQPFDSLLQLFWQQHQGNSQKFANYAKPIHWGLSGYGLYSYSAGNDLHNNQPIGSYKHVRGY